MSADATSLHDLSFSAMEEVLQADDVNPTHAKALWRALHREALTDLSGCDFLPPLRMWWPMCLIETHCRT